MARGAVQPMCSRRQGDITAIHIVQLMPRTRVPNTAVNSHCRGLNRREPQPDSFYSTMCSTIGEARDKKGNRKTSAETMTVT